MLGGDDGEMGGSARFVLLMFMFHRNVEATLTSSVFPELYILMSRTDELNACEDD